KEGAKLTPGEIRKAHRARALTSHPDKRPDDPNAVALFPKIQTAYDLLTDENARKAFDDFLRLRDERLQRQEHKASEISAKRRKMMDDLTRREKEFEFQKQQEDKEKVEETKAARKLQEEIARIRALHSQRSSRAFNFASHRVAAQDSKKEPP
ncbi:hypothetical protein KI387_033993, partial [Taxus chinensis]